MSSRFPLFSSQGTQKTCDASFSSFATLSSQLKLVAGSRWTSPFEHKAQTSLATYLET